MDRIAVVIPTLATPERAPYLKRAVDSALAQADVDVQLIVVGNGPAQHAPVLDDLAALSGVTVLRLDSAGMPGALSAGRRAVSSEFFAELDDDDELLPGALAARLDCLRKQPAADVVVSNGLQRQGGRDVPSIANIDAVRADPLRTLLSSNWLLPGAALFRTDRVPADWFDGMPSYLEWTYLGIRLALERRLAFLGTPSLLHYLDHPFSIDGSPECRMGRPAALRTILDLDMPDDVRRHLESKFAGACNGAARTRLAAGDLAGAWHWHWCSLRARGGLRFLSYTGKLLLQR